MISSTRNLIRIAAFLAPLVIFACSEDETPVDVPPPTASCIDFAKYVHIEGALDTPGQTRRAARAGDILYVADGASGVHVVDIQDPSDPSITATMGMSGAATDVVVDGSRLFVARGSSGIAIFDITNPLLPILLGQLDTPGDVLGIAVVDSLVYLADDDIGMYVVNVSDPSSPRVTGVENEPGRAQDVVAAGGMAYVSDDLLGLRVISFFNDTIPVLRETLMVPGTPHGIAASGTTVYIASVASIQVVDASNPDLPSIVGSVPMSGGVQDVEVQGNRGYAADRFNGVHILDLTDPLDPQVIASMGVAGEALGVNAFGELLVVSDPGTGASVKGIEIVDIDNPNRPPLVSVRDTADPFAEAEGVFMVKGAIYMCDGPAGVQTVNVSNPSSPTFVGNVPINGALHLATTGNVAYVASETAVNVLDVSNPFAPTMLPPVLPAANRVTVGDSLLFLVQGLAGVSIYRRLEPDQMPQFLQTVDSPTLLVAFDVAMTATHAFVAWGTSGMLVIDYAQIGADPVVAQLSTPAAARSIVILDHYAVIAISTLGVQIVDVATPTAPVEVGRVETPGNTTFVVVRDQIGYVADEKGGVQVVDLRDPRNPTIIGSISLGGVVTGTATDGHFLYATDRDSGLIITRAQCGI